MSRLDKDKIHCLQRAVLRERGCMPANIFVLIFKRIAHQNLYETLALAKPPPRNTISYEEIFVS